MRAALAGVLMLVAGLALAHPGYDWIMREPRYVAADGIHCCGRECFHADPARFREDGDGIAFDGQKLMLGRPGLYITRDPEDSSRWWVCILNGKVRCIWKPGSGV